MQAGFPLPHRLPRRISFKYPLQLVSSPLFSLKWAFYRRFLFLLRSSPFPLPTFSQLSYSLFLCHYFFHQLLYLHFLHNFFLQSYRKPANRIGNSLPALLEVDSSRLTLASTSRCRGKLGDDELEFENHGHIPLNLNFDKLTPAVLK